MSEVVFEEIDVKVAGWFFVTEADARQLAIKSLIAAVFLDENFQTMFLGGLGDCLVEWQMAKTEPICVAEATLCYNMMLMVDHHRIIAARRYFETSDLRQKYVAPIGKVIERVLMGQNQEEAIEATLSHYKEMRRNLPSNDMMPEFRHGHPEDLPNFTKTLSSRSLRRRLKEFKAILPYVFMAHRHDHDTFWHSLDERFKPETVNPMEIDIIACEIWALLIDRKITKFSDGTRPIRLVFT